MKQDKQKVLVLGASGMLGHKVSTLFSKNERYTLVNLVHQMKLQESDIVFDVTDVRGFIKLVDQISPDIIVNCIGALILQSKNSPDQAIWLNAYFPYLLSKVCGSNIKLIQISTDCVFSGKKGMYAENDFKDANDTYGRSKALGEIEDSGLHCTLRTSIIGPELKIEGSGLLHWFLSQNGEVGGFTNAIWGGVTTLELAKAIERATSEDLVGLFHVTNGEGISKYDLLSIIKDEFKLGSITLIPDTKYKVDKSLKKSDRHDFKVPSYTEMVRAMKEDLYKHREIYQHYF